MEQSSSSSLKLYYFLLMGLAIVSVLVNVCLLFLMVKGEGYQWAAIPWQDWGELAFHIATSILLIYFAHQLKKRHTASTKHN